MVAFVIELRVPCPDSSNIGMSILCLHLGSCPNVVQIHLIPVWAQFGFSFSSVGGIDWIKNILIMDDSLIQ